MRVDPKTARDIVFNALFAADGDRSEAAESLKVTQRTLDRYLKEYSLYEDMDRMGWIQHRGPPRQSSPEAGPTVAQLRVLDIVKAQLEAGELRYADIAKELYSEVNPTTMNRVYSALDALKQKKLIRMVDNKWAATVKA